MGLIIVVYSNMVRMEACYGIFVVCGTIEERNERSAIHSESGC